MRRGHIKLSGINALRTIKGGRLQAGISSDGPRLSSALDHDVVIVSIRRLVGVILGEDDRLTDVKVQIAAGHRTAAVPTSTPREALAYLPLP
jgi:hypothetical protein